MPFSVYQSSELQRILSKLKNSNFCSPESTPVVPTLPPIECLDNGFIRGKDYTIVDCPEHFNNILLGSEDVDITPLRDYIRSEENKQVMDYIQEERRSEYVLELFGMTFEFDLNKERYELDAKYSDIKELIYIIEYFFNDMHSVNSKGYVSDGALSGRFKLNVMENLKKFGYGYKEFGNNETTYTMWYNFIFVNLYRLLLTKIQEVELLQGTEL